MKNNPFANIFRNAFINDVLNGTVYVKEKFDYAHKNPRVSNFLDSLNKFLYLNGCAPLFYQKYLIDERKLLEYALFLRGYMRDAQPILATLSKEHASDPHLADLFKASSEYVVACNHQFGNKKFFDNNVGYRLWKLHTAENLAQANYSVQLGKINPNKHNLFLFMPFRIKDNQTEVNKWVLNNMRTTLDNKNIFDGEVDVYVQHFPIQKSRSSNIYSLLRTIKSPENYFEQTDLDFVKENWLDFVGQDISFEDNIIKAKALYSKEELCRQFGNITIFAYCSGAANAHRCLNALYDITQELYGKKCAKDAMQNIGVITYGFLPIQEYSLYSGVHFYTNAVDDVWRHEPFVNLNNHPLYEKTKCLDANIPARYSAMPDGRNFIIALHMPEEMVILQNNKPVLFRDSEYGHSLNFINQKNLLDNENYAYHIFCDTLEQFSLGKRHLDDINLKDSDVKNNIIINAVLKSKIQRL